MFTGKILSIHITPTEGQAMQSVESSPGCSRQRAAR